jgi:hypothetical protein
MFAHVMTLSRISVGPDIEPQAGARSSALRRSH